MMRDTTAPYTGEPATMAAAVMVLVWRKPMLYIAKKVLANTPITTMRQIGIGERHAATPRVTTSTPASNSAARLTRMKASQYGS